MDALRHDIRQAVRGLARSRATSFAAFLTLALGLGVTTALVSVVDGVLLRPLPYPDSEQLVRVSEQHRTAVSPLGDNLSNLSPRRRPGRHAKTLEGSASYSHRGVHLADVRRHRAASRARAVSPAAVRRAARDAGPSGRFFHRRRGAGGPRRRRRPEPRPVAGSASADATTSSARGCASTTAIRDRRSRAPARLRPSPTTSRGCGRRVTRLAPPTDRRCGSSPPSAG